MDFTIYTFDAHGLLSAVVAMNWLMSMLFFYADSSHEIATTNPLLQILAPGLAPSLLMGLLSACLKGLTKGSAPTLGELLFGCLIWMMIFVPKVNVIAEDIITGETVVLGDVPASLAIPSAIASSIARDLTEQMDTFAATRLAAMKLSGGGVDTLASTTTKGFMTPLRILAAFKAITFDSMDGDLAEGWHGYWRYCVDAAMKDGNFEVSKFSNAADPLDYISTHLPTTPQSVVLFVDVSGVRTEVTQSCSDAKDTLIAQTRDLPSRVNDQNENLLSRSISATAGSSMMRVNDAVKGIPIGDIDQAVDTLTNSTSTTSQLLSRVVFWNSFRSLEAYRTASSSGYGVEQYILATSKLESVEGATRDAAMLQDYILPMMSLVQYAFFLAVPFVGLVIVAMGFNAATVGVVMLAVAAFCYMWMPIQSFINYWVCQKVIDEIWSSGLVASFADQTQGNLSLTRLAGLFDVVMRYLTVGSHALAMTPIISGALLGGILKGGPALVSNLAGAMSPQLREGLASMDNPLRRLKRPDLAMSDQRGDTTSYGNSATRMIGGVSTSSMLRSEAGRTRALENTARSQYSSSNVISSVGETGAHGGIITAGGVDARGGKNASTSFFDSLAQQANARYQHDARNGDTSAGRALTGAGIREFFAAGFSKERMRNEGYSDGQVQAMEDTIQSNQSLSHAVDAGESAYKQTTGSSGDSWASQMRSNLDNARQLISAHAATDRSNEALNRASSYGMTQETSFQEMGESAVRGGGNWESYLKTAFRNDPSGYQQARDNVRHGASLLGGLNGSARPTSATMMSLAMKEASTASATGGNVSIADIAAADREAGVPKSTSVAETAESVLSDASSVTGSMRMDSKGFQSLKDQGNNMETGVNSAVKSGAATVSSSVSSGANRSSASVNAAESAVGGYQKQVDDQSSNLSSQAKSKNASHVQQALSMGRGDVSISDAMVGNAKGLSRNEINALSSLPEDKSEEAHNAAVGLLHGMDKDRHLGLEGVYKQAMATGGVSPKQAAVAAASLAGVHYDDVGDGALDSVSQVSNLITGGKDPSLGRGGEAILPAAAGINKLVGSNESSKILKNGAEAAVNASSKAEASQILSGAESAAKVAGRGSSAGIVGMAAVAVVSEGANLVNAKVNSDRFSSLVNDTYGVHSDGYLDARKQMSDFYGSLGSNLETQANIQRSQQESTAQSSEPAKMPSPQRTGSNSVPLFKPR